MAGDWGTIGAARRLRGLQPRSPAARLRETGGRLLTMLARRSDGPSVLPSRWTPGGFDGGVRRTHFRELRTTWRDWLTIVVPWPSRPPHSPCPAESRRKGSASLTV